MSTTGDPTVGGPSEAALAVLLAPPAADREGAVAAGRRHLPGHRLPRFRVRRGRVRDRAGLSFDRAYDPAGVARQLAAVLTTPDRTA